jgi:hypothetical protein
MSETLLVAALFVAYLAVPARVLVSDHGIIDH